VKSSQIFIAWLIVLLPIFAAGQKIVYNFERLSMEDGLPSNKIYDIIQDRRGLLWIGTDKGLCRYDGYRMKIFVHDSENSRSIGGNMIKRLFEARDGKIWIASLQTGLSCYDPSLPENEAFTNYRSNLKDSTTLRADQIFDVYEDSNGHIWVAGLDTDLQRLDPATGKFETLSLGGASKERKTFFRLTADEKKDQVWLATRYDGFFKFNPLTRKPVQFNFQHLSNATENSIGAFAIRDSKVWLSYYDLGVSVLDVKTNDFRADVFGVGKNKSFYDNVFYTLSFDSNDMLWGGHVNKGIFLFNTETGQSQRIGWSELTPGDTIPASVEVIFFDRGNVGWIGTLGKGLLKYDPYHNEFNQFNTFSDQANFGTILQLVEDDDHIWFRTKKGIGRYDSQLKRTDFFIDSSIKGIDVSEVNLINGVVFISTTNKGLWYVDRFRKQLMAIPMQGATEGLDNADINSVVADTVEGNAVLWIGSWGGGLYQYNRSSQVIKRVTKQDGLPDNKVITMAKDPSGRLWISTQGHGIACLRDKASLKFDAFTNDPAQPQSLPSNTVLSFYVDRQKRFWLGTTLGGIVEVIEENSSFHFRYFKDDKKNAYQGVHFIAEDSDGRLRLFTDNGIAIFHATTGRINHQHENASLYPSAFPITTIAMHHEFDILLGTNNGFLSRKHKPTLPQDINQVAIIGFKIFDQDYSHVLRADNIVLNHDQNFFAIEFTVPQYSETKNLTFAYKLIGVDKDWRYSGNDRAANYTDIKGGDYTFQVKAANGEGVWSDQIATRAISVTPSFWSSLWFKVILVVLIGLIIYIIDRYRIRQLLIIQRIRNNISKDLHDEVGATLSSIRILSEVAHQKMNENQLEYAGQLMSKVSVHAAEMTENMSDIIWAFNPYNDHLGKMIQRLQLQFYDLCAAREIRFQAMTSDQTTTIPLDLEVRKNTYLICKEAIHNAIKHADADFIELSISGGARLLKIDIHDNGKGFVHDPEGQGNGIRNMVLRAEQLNAEFKITSDVNGTRITIIFNPLRNGHTYFNL
jgi:ligand-binding sensor domain-containing protein